MKGSDRYRVEGVTCRVGEDRFPVVNVSVGGLFVAAQGAIPPAGLDIAIEVYLPGQAEGLPLVARVSWINEPVNPRVPRLPTGFGVKFVRVGFKEKMALLHLLRRVDPSAQRPRP